MKKKYVIIIALLAAGLGAWWWLSGDKKEENKLITVNVKKAPLIWSVDAVGEVFAENLVDVGTRASGQIKELYVKVGNSVKAGDKIAQIDDKIQKNSLESKEAELKSLEAKLEAAKVAYQVALSQYNRELALAKNNATSKENLENFKNALHQASANLKVAEASIAQSQISIKTAKEDLGYTNIIAPQDGTVVSVPVEVGQTLNAVQSAPTVAQIADLGKMEIRMEVSEADIGNVKVGDEVEYSILSDINKKYKGKVSSIDPGLTTLSDGKYNTTTTSTSAKSAVYYYVKMLVDNNEGVLRIGMTTQNKIIIRKIDEALQISLTAIKNDEEGSYALIKKGEDIVKQRIKLGVQTSQTAQIIEGLSEGDEVVASQMSTEQIEAMLKRKVRIH